MRNTTLPALIFATLLATGCGLFADLESEHPYPKGGVTIIDPCLECPEFCVEGECVEFQECDLCTDREQCVDGTCEPIEPCDDPADPDCANGNNNDPCDDPNAPDCADTKQCPSGEEVLVDERCRCEEEGSCLCSHQTGECFDCATDDGEPCECNDAVRCPGGGQCVDFRCIGEQPIGPCRADEPDVECEPCEPGSCPEGYDCVDEEGICHPSGCTQQDPLICAHICSDDVEPCPGRQTCINSLYCASEQCECPTNMACSIDDPVCRSAGGEPVRCETDQECAPGMCVENVCVGG
jgi:hypothetical protein